MKKRKRMARVVACVLAGLLLVGLFVPLANAVTVNNEADFVTVEESGIQGNNQTWDKLQQSYKSTLTNSLTEFDDNVSNNSGEFELVVRYGRALVAANWFTNNYYTRNGGDAISLLSNGEGAEDLELIEALNRISGMPQKIQDVLPETPDDKNGKVDTNAAFNIAVTNITVDTIVGYDAYQQALQSLLDNYVEHGIRSILDANGIVFDQEWVIAEGEATISSEMVNALTPYKRMLAPYAEVYNQVFSSAYGASLKALIASGKEENPANPAEPFEVVGYTRSHNFLNFIEENFDKEVLTVCTWLSTDTSTDNPGNVPQEGINKVDLSAGVLKALANAQNLNGQVVPLEGDLDLTELGYYVLAAGLIYDPFVSVAGNDTYIATLKEFMAETDKTEELIRTLQRAINTKKPLYVTDGAIDAWADEDELAEIDIADYRTAFLQDALSDDTRVTRGYVVLRGEMRPSAVDASTWDYVKGGTGTSNGEDGQASIEEGSSGSATDDGTVEVETSAVSGYRLAGSSELMASGSQVTVPLMYTSGNRYVHVGKQNAVTSLPRRIGGLTTTILMNAARNCRDNEYIQRADREMLFVNGLGDIVLESGVVVLPAIANPALYEYSAEADEELQDQNTGIGSADETNMIAAYVNLDTGYYPYTAAFMNAYPSASYSGSDTVQVTNANDEDKYIISANNTGVQATKIKSAGKKQVDVMDITTLPSVPIASGSFSVREDANDVSDLMPYLAMPQGFWRSFGNTFNHIGNAIFGLVGASDKESFNQRFLQTYTGARNSEGVPYFPIKEPDGDLLDSFIGQVGPLVTSAVRYVGTRDSMNTLSSSGKFRVEVFITDFIGEANLGTQYSEQLVKNNQLSYEELVADQYGRFTGLIKSFTSEVLNTIGHIDGVLAVKDGYGNGFFNVVMNFVQEFYVVIVVGLLIIVAAKFIKGRFSLFYVAAIGCLTFAAFNVYAVWMPTAVPAVYNFFVNDVVEEVTWNTVATTAEKYQQTYLDSNNKDASSGEERPYTATITLYKMTQAEMEDAAARLGVDIKTIRQGEMVYLDRPAGIYIQGDQIKMSVDSLLANNTMRGLYKSQWDAIDMYGVEDVEPISVDTNDNPYIIKLTGPYVSLEAYYTPFCHFERAFLVNLNNFANIFRVERNYYQYPGGLYKDAFLFNAYTDSGVFTAPGDDDVLALSILPDMILGSSLADAQDIIALCHQYLDPMEDWLNLLDVFAEPNEAMRTSLWGKAMQEAGYYNQDWTCDEAQALKLNELIYYINEQTKQFVIRNQDQLNFLSDENAIKLVSLYATTCFTHKVSSFGYWLYPNYVNSSDIELVDVLYGAMTTYKDRNAALDGDIVNTVVLNLGVVGALLILFITVVSVVFVFILTYLVPILYAMFGIILIYKLVNDEHSTGLVKGYVKVTLTSALLYIVFSCSMRLVKWGGYQWYGYLLCLLLAMLCLYFLFFVVLSVVTNPLELGNDVLARNMFGALDKLTGGRLGQLTSNHLTINPRYMVERGMSNVRGFLRRSSVDDLWRGRNSRRGYGGYGYGRYDDFDDTTLRGRVLGAVGSRFGFGGSGTDVGYRNSGRRGVFGRSSRRGQTSETGSSWGDRFDNFRHRNRRAS